jgi:hypothetical protein
LTPSATVSVADVAWLRATRSARPAALSLIALDRLTRATSQGSDSVDADSGLASVEPGTAVPGVWF